MEIYPMASPSFASFWLGRTFFRENLEKFVKRCVTDFYSKQETSEKKHDNLINFASFHSARDCVMHMKKEFTVCIAFLSSKA